jgi:hypothetical protein
MMNLKEFERTRSWPKQGIVPPFAWRNSGAKNISFRISGVPAEIRTGYLTNTGLNSDTISTKYKSHQAVSYLKNVDTIEYKRKIVSDSVIPAGQSDLSLLCNN